MRICDSHEEFEAVRAQLKLTACPHCGCVGNLIRHGYLRGYDSQSRQGKTVRGWRIYCSNRGRATGCGRTFSVWVASKIKRLFLAADDLWEFLRQAASNGGKLQGVSQTLVRTERFCALSNLEAISRVAKRDSRSADRGLRSPSDRINPTPRSSRWRIWRPPFRGMACPISAFQVQLQASFM